MCLSFLKHLGLKIRDHAPVIRAHNRGCRKISKLDKWSNDNLTNDDEKGRLFSVNLAGKIKEDDDLLVITCSHECLKAAYNYVEIIR